MKNCDEFIFYDDLARALAPRDKAPAKKKVAVADKTVADKTVADKAGADKAAPDKKPAAAPVVVAKPAAAAGDDNGKGRSEEHTSEPQSLMRKQNAVFCLKKKKHKTKISNR